MIHKDEEAKDMIHKDKEAEDMTNNDDAAQYDAATEHNATKFIYNHVTETKSKSILWQRKVKEKLTPNFYYSCGLANKKRLQGKKKKKKKGDTTPLSSTFILSPAAA